MGCVHSDEVEFDTAQKAGGGGGTSNAQIHKSAQNSPILTQKPQNGEPVTPVIVLNNIKLDISNNHLSRNSVPAVRDDIDKPRCSLGKCAFSRSQEDLAVNSNGKKKKRCLESFFPLWRAPRKCKQCTRSSDCINEQFLNSPSYTHCCKCCATEKAKADGMLTPQAHRKSSSSSGSSLANILALAALDLSAPASDALIRNRKNAWIQLAGHPGAFAPAGPNTIWKKRISKDNYELKAYESFKEDIASDIVPYFHREVEFNGEYFIEMEDLLQHFNDPCIMDVKMGRRTFLETEVENPALRKDLYDKMIKLDPNAPSEQEKEEAAITKLRYMQFREQQSSSDSLGFRIDAIRMTGEPPNTNLQKVKTVDQIVKTIQSFLNGNSDVQETLLERLKDIRDKIERSQFLMSHEIIGSSILLMYDRDSNSGAWMIDFAKTLPVEKKLTHRLSWKHGNHEDGYLFGMDNLIQDVYFVSSDFLSKEVVGVGTGNTLSRKEEYFIFEENNLAVKSDEIDSGCSSSDIR